jgi:RecA-family ATPase
MSTDVDPEAMVVGACLYPNDGFRDASKFVRPEDFGSTTLAKVFEIIGKLQLTGVVPDPGTVSALFPEHGIRDHQLNASQLWAMLSQAGSGSVAEFWAVRVHDVARRRRAFQAISVAGQGLNAEGLQVDDTLKQLSEDVKNLMDDTVSERIQPEFLVNLLADENDDYDWLVEGLFEKGDRMIVTAAEGFGKTTWLRQLAVMFAAGIHPTRNCRMMSSRVLYIDPENSKSQWRREVRPMVRAASMRGTADPAHNIRLACTPRLNLVTGHDLAKIHRLIDEWSPEMLFIGPLYKLTSGSLNNEDDAAALINSLDSIRDRGVVLVMEAHAAKGYSGQRNWTPRGSGALAAWPEFGLALVADPEDENACTVERWRGDRDAQREWPKKMAKGRGTYPWVPMDAD